MRRKNEINKMAKKNARCIDERNGKKSKGHDIFSFFLIWDSLMQCWSVGQNNWQNVKCQKFVFH